MTVEDVPYTFWPESLASASPDSLSLSPHSSPTPPSPPTPPSAPSSRRDSVSAALAAFARLNLSRGRRPSAAETAEFARLFAASDPKQPLSNDDLARFMKKLFADEPGARTQRGRRLHNSPVRFARRRSSRVAGERGLSSASPARGGLADYDDTLTYDDEEEYDDEDDEDETLRLPLGFKSGWGWSVNVSPERERGRGREARGRQGYRRRSSSAMAQRRRARESSSSHTPSVVRRRPSYGGSAVGARCCCGEKGCGVGRHARDVLPRCRDRSLSPRSR
ncbi:hypothetical protein BZA70DRAFT_280401 [Myxozyma melibiosi]|uniref:Uncharacterized protein n=1 Tax=Myxozyma melibiosi TaxID=54550 RepID=A0ABR1F361_9ASCO